MSLQEYSLEIIIGVATSLIAGFILLLFRDRVASAFSAINISSGRMLIWLVIFTLLITVLILVFQGKEVPQEISIPLIVAFFWMISLEVWSGISSKK